VRLQGGPDYLLSGWPKATGSWKTKVKGLMISPTTLMDLKAFIIEFQDYLAPKLDTYEQAIHLYIFRHTRLLGLTEATFGFKSARSRMACGVGEKGKPMSDHTAYLKLTSLDQKQSTRGGSLN
jgi:hypothetical protein